jgi:hypothetical protein
MDGCASVGRALAPYLPAFVAEVATPAEQAAACSFIDTFSKPMLVSPLRAG